MPRSPHQILMDETFELLEKDLSETVENVDGYGIDARREALGVLELTAQVAEAKAYNFRLKVRLALLKLKA